MAQDYKISNVSEEVKPWNSAYGPMVTYTLFLEETGEEIIQQNKKPDSPAPKVGDAIYGNIERNAFGAKFKSEARIASPSGLNSPGKAPASDYEPGTNARWAVGMAYRAFIQVTGTPEDAGGNFPFEAVKQHALELVRMFDEVKNSGSVGAGPPSPPIKEVIAPAAVQIQDKLKQGFGEPEYGPEDMP